MMALKPILTVICAAAVMTASAAEPKIPDENFMLVLREVEGANKQQFGFSPSGPSTATLSNGENITIDNAWFGLLGHMHVRFVVDGEHSMQNLTAEEFSGYALSAEQAVEIAISNIKKRYGEPRATPWDNGIMQVAGESADLDSSYFLDRPFWNALPTKHPDGVVVGVPKRGGLIYAPVSNREAVAILEASILSLYESSGNMRVSSALYLYKGNAWSVHRKPASLH